MSELEEDYDCNKGSGEMTGPGYTVEARSTYQPKKVGDQIFDNKWRKVCFTESIVGVLASRNREIAEHGMLDYAAAQALRWWFIANAGFVNCFESRLVKHELIVTHKITAISCHEHIGGEDRSDMMPDWGESLTKDT